MNLKELYKPDLAEDQKELIREIHILSLLVKFATVYQKALWTKNPDNLEFAAEEQLEMVKKWLIGYEDLKK